MICIPPSLAKPPLFRLNPDLSRSEWNNAFPEFLHGKVRASRQLQQRVDIARWVRVRVRPLLGTSLSPLSRYLHLTTPLSKVEPELSKEVFRMFLCLQLKEGFFEGWKINPLCRYTNLQINLELLAAPGQVTPLYPALEVSMDHDGSEGLPATAPRSSVWWKRFHATYLAYFKEIFFYLLEICKDR